MIYRYNKNILQKERIKNYFSLSFFINTNQIHKAKEYFEDCDMDGFSNEEIENIERFFDDYNKEKQKISGINNICPTPKNCGMNFNLSNNSNSISYSNLNGLKILSLDGGGIKGIIHLFILSEMEFCCNG